MSVNFPDPTEEEGLVVKSRLEEFYSNDMTCEFEGCDRKATHHCIDTDPYWKGCGRVFCDNHAKSASNTTDGEALAFICDECNLRQINRKCYYNFIVFIVAFVTMGLLWKFHIIQSGVTKLLELTGDQSYLGGILNLN